MRSKLYARLIMALGLVLLGFMLSDTIDPHHTVSAQNAGVVGIQAQMIPVFTAQTTTAHSAIFNDIGQGVNILRICNTAFTGSVNLEWSPTNNGTYLPLQTATFPNPDSNCHSLTVSGYWPALRSTLTVTGGSASAWYTASSGPGGYVPAIGSNGPTFPVSCDENSITTEASGAGPAALAETGVLFGGSSTSVICSFTVSFSGATTAAAPGVEIGWAANGSCSPTSYVWSMDTTASTPQTFPFPITLRSANPSAQVPCLNNLSGATVVLSVNYAVVQL